MLPLHRKLAIATVFSLIGAFAIWYLLIYPLKQQNDEIQEDQQRAVSELRQKGYPTDAGKLRTMRRDLQQQRNQLRQRLEAVYDKAMGQYGERLNVYDSVLGFRRGVGQLDYQVAFNRSRRELEEAGLYLHERLLGLSEESTSEQMYQLVAHLWTVHDLALLCQEHNLNLVDRDYAYTDEERAAIEGRLPPPARLTILPVRTYSLPDSEAGFLEEYPVSCTVDGSLQDVTALLAALTQDVRFLPLEHISIRKIGANNPRSDRVEATFRCSSFLILAERQQFIPKVQTESRHNVPPPRPGI